MYSRSSTQGPTSPSDLERPRLVCHAAIRALGRHRFDFVVCAMTLMDIPDPAAMFRGLRHVLKVRCWLLMEGLRV